MCVCTCWYVKAYNFKPKQVNLIIHKLYLWFLNMGEITKDIYTIDTCQDQLLLLSYQYLLMYLLIFFLPSSFPPSTPSFFPGSHLSKVGLASVKGWITFNFWSFCFHLPSAGDRGAWYTWFTQLNSIMNPELVVDRKKLYQLSYIPSLIAGLVSACSVKDSDHWHRSQSHPLKIKCQKINKNKIKCQIILLLCSNFSVLYPSLFK